MERIDRWYLGVVATILFASTASAQTFANSSSTPRTRVTTPPVSSGAFRSSIRTADERGNAADAVGSSDQGLTPVKTTGQTRVAGSLSPIAVAQGQPSLGRITAGTGTLPNDAGQVWREYDLSPYTSAIKNVERPEQAVVDWILRETGTDVWFSSPLGILSADKNTLRVYHTPDIQEKVKGIYDRFLANSAEPNRLGLRIITVANPGWRTQAMKLLKPIEVKSTGVDAWIVSRENAVLLMNELRQRVDVKDHGAPQLEIANGQTAPVEMIRKKPYIKSIRPRPEMYPGFEPETAVIDEGYSISLSPLAAVDNQSIDVVLKCNIDQVEKFITVGLDVPAQLGAPIKQNIQVPQLVSWRLHERFRWPTDHILVLSCGVVVTPTGESNSSIPLIGSLVTNNRADALMLLEVLPPKTAGTPALPVAVPLTVPGVPGALPAVPGTGFPPATNPGIALPIGTQPFNVPPLGVTSPAPVSAVPRVPSSHRRLR